MKHLAWIAALAALATPATAAMFGDIPSSFLSPSQLLELEQGRTAQLQQQLLRQQIELQRMQIERMRQQQR